MGEGPLGRLQDRLKKLRKGLEARGKKLAEKSKPLHPKNWPKSYIILASAFLLDKFLHRRPKAIGEDELGILDYIDTSSKDPAQVEATEHPQEYYTRFKRKIVKERKW